MPVLDFDDPEIAINAGFALEIVARVVLGDRLAFETRHPAPVKIGVLAPGGCWPKNSCMTIEVRDLDIDRAGIIIAVPNDNRVRPVCGTAADISLRPDFRFKTHGGNV